MNIENTLLKEFLKISKDTRSVFKDSVDVIYKILDCKHCSLWKVNQQASTVSLLAYQGFNLEPEKDEYFVHKISGSFSEHILKESEDYKNQIIPDIKENSYFSLNTWKPIIENEDCSECIPLLIPVNLENEEIFKALLYIYPSDPSLLSKETIGILKDYMSLAIYNHYIAQKEKLTSTIIDLHLKKGDKDISSILHPIINSILKNYIDYEAASAFIWDSFENTLKLSATTGLEGDPRKNEVYYNLGEGITGSVALDGIERIINLPMDKALTNDQERKYKEKKKHPSKSLLYIPIKRIGDNSIVGVLRIINRINSFGKVIDYFSKVDLKLLSQVSYLIGLYMEFDQTEKTISGFSKQMVHEIQTPAVGIRGMADRLVNNQHKPRIMNKYLFPYLRDILEYSDLQLAQTHTIAYLWSRKGDQPKSTTYTVDYANVKEIIYASKKVVIPMTRDSGLTFDNIKILGTFPRLYIDKHAFKSVFLNLLTNCIKYRKRNTNSDFLVQIEGLEVSSKDLPTEYSKKHESGFLIKVLDQGIGIPEEEGNKIFNLGYRRREIEKYDIRGLGMGLTVVHRVLTDFGCKIWLHSNYNPTEFRIFIPLHLLDLSYTKKGDWINP